MDEVINIVIEETNQSVGISVDETTESVGINLEETNETVTISVEEILDQSNVEINVEENVHQTSIIAQEITETVNIQLEETNETVTISIEQIAAAGKDCKDLTEYRSDYTDPYIYSGFLLEGQPIIKRCLDNLEEFAENVVDLDTDWNNRLNLTYNP